MNATEFMLNAKLGLLNAKASRPISNKGTIGEIRKRTEEAMRPPGFPSYANLGSQNAITTGGGGGHEARLVIDVETPKEPETKPGTETTFVPPVPKKELIGGSGGKQTEKSKKEAEERAKEDALAPKHKPPYDLTTPTGVNELEQYVAYAKARYGGDVGRMKADEVTDESGAFTLLMVVYHELEKKRNEFASSPNQYWGEWFHNFFANYLDNAIDGISAVSGVVFPEAVPMITGVAYLIKRFTPKSKDATSFMTTAREMQHKIFEGHPDWLDKVKQTNDEAMRKFIDDMESGGKPANVPGRFQPFFQ